MISVTKPPCRRSSDSLVAIGRFDVWQGWTWKDRLWDVSVQNIATILGLNNMADVNYGATAKTAAWYIGVIAAAAYSAVSSSDTIVSHSGWAEWTSYTGNRPTWSPGAAAAGVIFNSTYATLTPNASTGIQGFFIASDNTRGGTTGLLDATGVLGSARTVTSGTPIQIRYTKTLTPG